ncbi:hypothetical protein SK3146_06467 [Paenibacillus konkukensis]|uniref:UPF0637 protein SK3146_06467 n=1 Tax=Paenibacillus konkukensis TaxID=2020716 RepID=A0ABY4RZM1_9BACL|nr:DUF1054 domain-containing protein [Paenibacillus konkukensis]UQZ87170.1 hypothetical protein SK3146_06467 [Paenibacillus konkukensis]
MAFQGFTQADFDVFTTPGLEARMEGIQGLIQPKFKAIGDALCDETAVLAGDEMFLHIAKHARRTVNAPVDTWMALCHNKRGYKQHPHFQVGLFDDRVFVWLALIYELPEKQAIARAYLNELDRLRDIIPSDYKLSFDHMKKDAVAFGELSDNELQAELERFRDVKKAELLIGRTLLSSDPVLADGEQFLDLVRQTIRTLMPLYQTARNASI